MQQTLLLPLILFISLNLTAQSTELAGTYEVIYRLDNAEIDYVLNLRTDGTFRFHFYRYNYCSICVKENYYGKGTWTAKKNWIYFSTETNDVDETHTLDLNNTKARFDPDGVLRFIQSEISWVKGMKLKPATGVSK